MKEQLRHAPFGGHARGITPEESWAGEIFVSLWSGHPAFSVELQKVICNDYMHQAFGAASCGLLIVYATLRDAAMML